MHAICSLLRAAKIVVIACTLHSLFCSTALAQSRSELFAPPITVHELSRLLDEAKASPEQRLAAADAHERYDRDFRSLRAGTLAEARERWTIAERAFPSPTVPDPALIRDGVRKVRDGSAAIAELDEACIESLAAILSPDQLHAIERLRTRRTLVAVTAALKLGHEFNAWISLGLEIGPAETVEQAGVTLNADDQAILDAAIRKHEVRLAAALTRLAATRTPAILSVSEIFESSGLAVGTPFTQEDPRIQTAWNEALSAMHTDYQQLPLKVNQILHEVMRYLSDDLHALTDPVVRTFVRFQIFRWTRSFTHDLQSSKGHSAVLPRLAAKIDASADPDAAHPTDESQREALRGVVIAASAELAGYLERALIASDQYINAPSSGSGDHGDRIEQFRMTREFRAFREQTWRLYERVDLQWQEITGLAWAEFLVGGHSDRASTRRTLLSADDARAVAIDRLITDDWAIVPGIGSARAAAWRRLLNVPASRAEEFMRTIADHDARAMELPAPSALRTALRARYNGGRPESAEDQITMDAAHHAMRERAVREMLMHDAALFEALGEAFPDESARELLNLLRVDRVRETAGRLPDGAFPFMEPRYAAIHRGAVALLVADEEITGEEMACALRAAAEELIELESIALRIHALTLEFTAIESSLVVARWTDTEAPEVEPLQRALASALRPFGPLIRSAEELFERAAQRMADVLPDRAASSMMYRADQAMFPGELEETSGLGALILEAIHLCAERPALREQLESILFDRLQRTNEYRADLARVHHAQERLHFDPPTTSSDESGVRRRLVRERVYIAYYRREDNARTILRLRALLPPDVIAALGDLPPITAEGVGR